MGKHLQHLRHPEARHDAIRAKAAERSASAIRLSDGRWRWPFGWAVFLYQADGTIRGRDAKTYEEAIAIRDDEMLGDFAEVEYTKAWIVQKRS